jgi:hypothetical protein
MELLTKNIGQVAVLAAFIALIGVVLKAFSDWLASSRSTYVEVIAAERIKWVAELRSDFREFAINLDEVAFQCRQSPMNRVAANKALDEVNRHLGLIQLKLNYEDSLDNALLGLMSKASFFARTGTLIEYTDYRSLMTQYQSFLLKDEWEKAKREAAGPARWLWLTWKRRLRLKSRSTYLASPAVKAKLDFASQPLSAENLQKVMQQQGVDPPTQSGSA